MASQLSQFFRQPSRIGLLPIRRTFLREFRFIPSKTTVLVTGGSPGYDLNLTIAGRFGLVTGYDEVVSPPATVPSLVPHAEFIDVHGILFNPLSLAPLPLPGWDLDKTLNLSGLHGTFSVGDPNDLFFLGARWPGCGAAIASDHQWRLAASDRRQQRSGGQKPCALSD